MPTLKVVELTHAGGMLFKGAPSSGHAIDFDVRSSNKGGSPVETVLAALGACTAMDVLSIALKKRQGIDSYRIEVRGSQRDEYPQVYTRIDIVHEVIGAGVSVKAIARCIELSATKYCPVSAMLAAGATEIHHHYRVTRTGKPTEEAEVLVTGPYQRPDVIAEPVHALARRGRASGAAPSRADPGGPAPRPHE